MDKPVDVEKLSLYETPEDSPGYLLWRVSMHWRSAIEATLKPLGLTHPQFVVLATIGWLTRKNEKVSQADISRAAGLDPNTISQIIRGLEAKELIQRVRSLDERSKSPVLTSMGSQKLAKALPAVELADTQFFNVLNAKELNGLIKIFQSLISLK
jgi:DNA-binding MarR family transcriptional regulator